MRTLDGGLIEALSSDFAYFYKDLLLEVQTLFVFGSPAEKLRAYILFRQFEKKLLAVDAQAKKWMEENVPIFYHQGDEWAQQQLRALGVSPNQFYQVSEGAIWHVVATMKQEITHATSQYKENLLSYVRHLQVLPDEQRAILQNIARSAALGTTISTTSKNIQERLVARSINGYLRVGKRTIKLDQYAEMIARTHLRVAHSRGTEARCRATGIELVIISEHSTDCKICKPLEGKIFSLNDKGTAQYPSVRILPNGGTPFHPNCLHVESPLIPELAGEEVMREGIFEAESFPFLVSEGS
jgi:hypothetical protein